MTQAAELIHRCENALNMKKNEDAKKILAAFDSLFANKGLSSNIIYARLYLGSEVHFRLGEYEKGIEEIDNNIQSIRANIEQTIKILLYRGKMEKMINRHGLSISSFSEALGLAESTENPTIIGNVYSEISRMFSVRYIGLALYFIRKAEVFYNRNNEKKLSSLAKIDRAFISFTAYLLNRHNGDYEKLKEEAIRIVQEINEEDFNLFERRQARLVKSIVLCDAHDLLKQYEEAEQDGALPSICIVGEAYIAACIERNDKDAALAVYDKHAKYSLQFHGIAVKKNLDELKNILTGSCKAEFIPWHLYKKPDEQTNLLDILDHFSLGEELWRYKQGRFSGLFPGIEHEGMFDSIIMENGKVSLIPCNPAFNDYYRGQSSYYEKSYPSLFRDGMTPDIKFLERLKYEEFKLLVAEYPITKIFSSGLYVKYPDNSTEPVSLNVDFLALAQHYGIKTELMDVTTDKFVAAFFASTEYTEDGAYKPITTKQQNPGVFYHYVDIPFPGVKSRLRAVGLQPLSRPGEQAGFVVEMKEQEDFNNMVRQKIQFCHDAEIAEFIFNFANRSKKLFPKSILEDKAKMIINSNKFSKMAFDAACEEFYSDINKSVCLQYVNDLNIELTDTPLVLFTKEEIDSCIKDWNEHGLYAMDKKVITRFCLTKHSTRKQ